MTVFISVSDRERIRTVYRLDGAEKAFRYVQGARRRKGIEPHACLMGGEAFMAIGKSFATHENVKHSSREFVRDAAHVNSVGGFKSRVRRTIAGVFHHISPQHALSCHEIGFRWSQRIVTSQAVRILVTGAAGAAIAASLSRYYRPAMRRSPDAGIIVKSPSLL
nr:MULTISPECIES: transposase [Rhizobium]